MEKPGSYLVINACIQSPCPSSVVARNFRLRSLPNKKTEQFFLILYQYGIKADINNIFIFLCKHVEYFCIGLVLRCDKTDKKCIAMYYHIQIKLGNVLESLHNAK